MRRGRIAVFTSAFGVCLGAAGAQGPALLARFAQPRAANGPVASIQSTIVLLESPFNGFANGSQPVVVWSLVDGAGKEISGTNIDVTVDARINGVRITSGGIFTGGQDTIEVGLNFAVIPLILEAFPSAASMRITVADVEGKRGAVVFVLDNKQPTLVEAILDDSAGDERLILRFDADLTNADPDDLRASSAERDFEPAGGAGPPPLLVGPGNDVNQTTPADLASLDDFEIALDADFTAPAILDASLVGNPRILEDRRTILYEIHLPGAFGEGIFVRVAQNSDITSITNLRAAGVAQITGAARSLLPADLSADGVVDGADVGLLLGAWGRPDADLNADGVTDGADLGLLLSAWGARR